MLIIKLVIKQKELEEKKKKTRLIKGQLEEKDTKLVLTTARYSDLRVEDQKTIDENSFLKQQLKEARERNIKIINKLKASEVVSELKKTQRNNNERAKASETS